MKVAGQCGCDKDFARGACAVTVGAVIFRLKARPVFARIPRSPGTQRPNSPPLRITLVYI